jgi:hypothetical protein
VTDRGGGACSSYSFLIYPPTTLEHTLSAIPMADMLYDKKCRRSEQSPASKSKLDKVPVTMDVSWEGYTDLGWAGLHPSQS